MARDGGPPVHRDRLPDFRQLRHSDGDATPAAAPHGDLVPAEVEPIASIRAAESKRAVMVVTGPPLGCGDRQKQRRQHEERKDEHPCRTAEG